MLVGRLERCLEGIVAQAAVAMRSRSCGSRELVGSWLVAVLLWLGVGMLPALLTGFEAGSRRCAIGLAEPALRQVDPALRMKTWRYRHQP